MTDYRTSMRIQTRTYNLLKGNCRSAHLSVFCSSCRCLLLLQTLHHLSSSPSLSYLVLVGTCWAHHYLTRLAPPPPPRSCDGIERRILPLASVFLAAAECTGISWDAAEVFAHPLLLIFFSLDCHYQGDCVDSPVCHSDATYQGQRTTRHWDQCILMWTWLIRVRIIWLYITHVETMLLVHISLTLSPLSRWCFPAGTDPPSLLGKLQSVSAICSRCPPPPNYNTTESRLIQHTSVKVQQPRIISGKYTQSIKNLRQLLGTHSCPPPRIKCCQLSNS